MTHLLKLDELVSSDQDLRTKRKEHVKDIQRLLGDVDNIKGKLNHVQTKIEQEYVILCNTITARAYP